MSRLSVLVVHPDPETAGRIAAVVSRLGHEPLVVPDGERAIDRFIQSPSDVIVIELVLPGRDGGTTVESVRWAPGGDTASVVLLGTRGTSQERISEIGRRVRALATLPGPLNENVLESLLAGVAGPMTQPTRVGNVGDIERLLSSTDEQLAQPITAEIQDSQSTDQRIDPSASSPGSDLSTDELTAPSGGRAVPAPGRPDPTAFDEEMYTDVDDELLGEWSIGSDPNAEREGRVVDGWARVTETTGEGVQGDLADTPFPRLLNRLAETRATGGLVITALSDARRTTTGESPKKVLYFRNGVPTYVQSNLVQECLGQVLARGGHFSIEVLDESIRRMSAGEGRQGAVLINMGAIEAHQLRDALEDQLRVKLFDLFAWQRGLYRFSDRMIAPAEAVTLEMSLSEIVLKGVVHRIPPQRLLSALSPHLNRYVVPELPRMATFRNLEMPPQARALLHGIDGTAQLRSLLGRAGERPGAAAQLLFALYCTDAIHFAELPLPTERLPTGDEATRVASPIADLAATREELGRLGRLLRAERYAEALGVEHGDEDEARLAAQGLTQRFTPLTEGAGPRDLRALAFEVCARLVHAREAFSTEPRPPTVVAKRRLNDLADAFNDIPTEDQKRRGVVEPVDPFADEVITSPLPESQQRDDDASDERSERITRPETKHIVRPPSAEDLAESAEPDWIPAEQLRGEPMLPDPVTLDRFAEETLDPDADDPERTVPEDLSLLAKESPSEEEAPADEEPPADEEAAEEVDPELSFDDRTTMPEHARTTEPPQPPHSGRRAHLPPDPPTEAAPLSGEQLDARVEAIAQAERYFRRGERACNRSRWQDAAVAFERAVELCPDEGEFLAYLSWARFSNAPDDATVVEDAAEALRKSCAMSPKLDTPYLLLARVLTQTGDVAGARNAYERALSANPDCREALDALRS